jgi:hypothetical protein
MFLKLARIAVVAITGSMLALGVAASPATAGAGYVDPPEPVSAGTWQRTGGWGSSTTCNYNRSQYRNAGWTVTYCYQLNGGSWYFDRIYS